MEKMTVFFKALSENTRLEIINILLKGDQCVCKIMDDLQLSQPAVSHHMKILKQAGLVNAHRQGKWIHYSLNKDAFKEIEQILQEELFIPINIMNKNSVNPCN
ncbi:MAG: ArsR family transcriptional regulator [Candidatus Syntrophonatronum acetioxidans]|uniref:ArsR family transcriptional regulator n=1 Tax=Candidatus Syntrophonatronum acetioxidans TaxID=1795816 RepID=A0A424YI99_9FIRM|nr:MAG: ArsR family transcriptional regulator [Candidatus Syntrophonatronum acetioxidans]